MAHFSCVKCSGAVAFFHWKRTRVRASPLAANIARFESVREEAITTRKLTPRMIFDIAEGLTMFGITSHQRIVENGRKALSRRRAGSFRMSHAWIRKAVQSEADGAMYVNRDKKFVDHWSTAPIPMSNGENFFPLLAQLLRGQSVT